MPSRCEANPEMGYTPKCPCSCCDGVRRRAREYQARKRQEPDYYAKKSAYDKGRRASAWCLKVPPGAVHICHHPDEACDRGGSRGGGRDSGADTRQ